MATKSSKPNKKPVQGDLVVRLIGAITEALARLITASVSTIVALGILVILAIIIIPAPPEIQQQTLPLLTGMLGVIIGRMLPPGPQSPKSPETPSPSG
jgi:hypothetical protein